MLFSLIVLVAGFAILVVGGELLVRGAVQLAARARVSPLLVGIVIIGFGTSMPELVTSVRAAIAGAPGIAWGNVVGSNLINTLAILGVAALIGPFAVAGKGVWRDGVMALGATALLYALAQFGSVGRWAGAALLALLVGYLLLAYFQERGHPETNSAALDKAAAHEELEDFDGEVRTPWPVALLMVLAGLALLIIGGGMLVHGSVALARVAGISETVIGLTIVAFGTSAPELVTAAVAAWRRHGALAFGNVIGSNLYNILGIGGFTAIVAPHSVPAELLPVEFPVLLASAFAVLVIAAWRGRFGRLAGAILLGGYLAHLLFLLFAA
ncbi:calcium/sodium antiporter [Parasphingopyxis marina]|uniref:Calcium/sodium antiporter n=1 Tax=Parasphingopyxis marina TaxID=2761622 RepID=A0A842I0S1_9SPHN|nr:calcium/sodium antiporter [Parasphingopyxis marina]MBC2778447.1 calcium/sodium antiporter [Parasphingopyxis marina]